MNINPWLGEVIAGFRPRHSDEEMKRNPFLATSREEMGFPEKTAELLKVNSVHKMADLLQMTEEDYLELFKGREDEITPIRTYLQAHGLHLYHSEKLTWKVDADLC